MSAATINVVTHWLNYVLAIPMIALGIIGEILTVVVFTGQRSFSRNPTIIYPLAGAIITAIHLPCNYLQSVLVDGFGLGLFNVNIGNCRQQNYIRFMTTVSAISFPCWAAFDQYISTCPRSRFSKSLEINASRSISNPGNCTLLDYCLPSNYLQQPYYQWGLYLGR